MLRPCSRLRLNTSLRQYVHGAAALASGPLQAGHAVAAMEEEIARRVGRRHAISMPMARIGLYFVIKSLIRPRQKVILSPYTIAEVVNMVICAGGDPVFCDIDRTTCNMDPACLEALLDELPTEEVGLVLATHFYGLTADMDRINAAAARRGVPVIEDAAQAFGAQLNGRQAGTFGTAGVFSFGMYKTINCFFGGAVVTDDDTLATRLRDEMAALPVESRQRWGRKMLSALITDVATRPPAFPLFFFPLFRWAFINDVEAINNKTKIDINPQLMDRVPPEYLCRLSDPQAHMVLAQIDGVAANIRARIAAASRYHDGLQGLPGLILPPLRLDGSHLYWYFPIQAENHKDLVRHAMRQGRDITVSYHRNCADMPCFKRWFRDCPNARATAASLIYLPTYPAYGGDEIDRTISAIRSYYDSRIA